MATNSAKPTAILSDNLYTFVRRSATIILPAVGALYFALAQIWGLPAAEEVVGTVAALNVFAGVLASVSKKIYDDTGAKYDGTFDIALQEDGKRTFSLNLDSHPDDMVTKNEVTFRVDKK